MTHVPSRPLVAIVGATGTGKSDLAVEIARKFNGEIINGDAMQLYRGLPIITNKITEDEMQGIPHHLLGCISLEEETWTVSKFVGNALRVIDEIRSRGKLPILVGGTHYYTQSLLFKDALSDNPMPSENGVEKMEKEVGREFPILKEPTEVIMAKLKEVDPVMADRWHPNERRKIQRSLELYLKTGKPASQIYNEQRATVNPSLRFPTLLFWVHAPKEILYPRLDSRITKMLERGLLDEVRSLTDFQISAESSNRKVVDQSRGIWVSIGYKEFLDYQVALSGEPQDSVQLEKIKTAAVEKTQAATRQYANRQLRWIRIKLLNAMLSANQQNNMFFLDGSDLEEWSDRVIQPAANITKSFLSGSVLPNPTELSPLAAVMLTPKRDYDLSQRPDLWQKRVCETCGTVAVTENEWNLHMKSRGHRRAVVAKKKQENAQYVRRKELKAAHADVVDVLEASLHTLTENETSE